MACLAPDPDHDMVVACQHGDQHVFESLMMKYQNQIFSLMLRMLGDYDTALDLTQDTFLQAYQGIKGFKLESTFFTWLFRIALNLATNQRRTYLRHPRTVSLSRNKPDDQNESYTADLQDSLPSPETTLIQQETRSLVQKAISLLPPEFRETVILRDIQGLSYEQIQEILQCPIGTVRSRLHRGRDMLKDKLVELGVVV